MPKTSCEPGRRSAYSTDLRWRMVWQKEVLGLRYQEVAAHLNVDIATVWRIVKLFKETGSVEKKVYPIQQAYRKLTTPVELIILHLVLERPGIYLREIQAVIFEFTGVDASCSAICKLLSKVGYTRQKMKYAALQRDDFLRSQFVSDVSLYDKDMLVFVDESGFDRRNTLRKYGYSLRGKPPVCHNLFSRGQHLSLIASMSTGGVIDCDLVEGGVNGDVFYSYVEKFLLPNLMTFDGKNPQSIVILDNCSIHHVQDTVQMICSIGALIHFLPPYSPDYNPIELMFSKLKHVLKSLEKDYDDFKTAILSAITYITQNDCYNWVDHCSIYN